MVLSAKAAAYVSASGVDHAVVGCRLEEADSGNKVLGPTRHRNTPDVDLAPSSPAKSESDDNSKFIVCRVSR